MRNKLAIMLFIFLIPYQLFPDIILPRYIKTQKVNEEKIYNPENSKLIDTTGNIGILCNDTKLSVRLEGKQLQLFWCIEHPEVILKWQEIDYMIPYTFIQSNLILLEIDISLLSNYDNKWILKLTTIGDNTGRGNSEYSTWFLMQVIGENILISDILFGKAEDSNESLRIERFGSDSNLFFNLGFFQYYSNMGVLCRDTRFLGTDWFQKNYSKDFTNLVSDNVNVRNEPKIDSVVNAVIPAGIKIKAIEYAGNAEYIDGYYSPWIKITYNNQYFIQYRDGMEKYGYIFGKYFK